MNDLRGILDAIDQAVLDAARPSYLEAAKMQAKGMIDKGRAILEKYPTVKDGGKGGRPKKNIDQPRGALIEVSFNSVATETGRLWRDIKKWVLLAKKYPTKQAAQEWIESKAETQTQKYIEGTGNALVEKMTGNAENYTPLEIIEAIREVMGSITLDPASCKMAQKIVKAEKYYTQETDGLSKKWEGNIFLNPPYGMPEIKLFADKLLSELSNIESAILLTNDQTDTLWFQSCALRAKVICFTTGRIGFYTPTKEKTAPTNGQAFMYFGNDEKKFIEIFSRIGILVRPIRG